jgi:GNAT superfamily N-acetyltransferase
MTFALRPTTPADIPTLHRLMRDFARYEKLQQRFRITEAELNAALFGPKPPIDSILADVAGATVGFAMWSFQFGTFTGRWNLFVDDIYVDPAHRSSGIGYALFQHMARLARARGCIDMEWKVLDWNTPAIEFYRRIGAKLVRGWIEQELDENAMTALAEGAGTQGANNG